MPFRIASCGQEFIRQDSFIHIYIYASYLKLFRIVSSMCSLGIIIRFLQRIIYIFKQPKNFGQGNVYFSSNFLTVNFIQNSTIFMFVVILCVSIGNSVQLQLGIVIYLPLLTQGMGNLLIMNLKCHVQVCQVFGVGTTRTNFDRVVNILSQECLFFSIVVVEMFCSKWNLVVLYEVWLGWVIQCVCLKNEKQIDVGVFQASRESLLVIDVIVQKEIK
eukprot:TRINITY_DN5523_c0_g1_i6.p1 TRINITY_DN5523_c0_g1~~TRINITY_DN5523_c0_g1_i6.p1  ORF type:complete len:217 (+),score=-5.62 TRINITY_DN5523_c0_g1_i6:748-1398(+)